MLMGKSIFRSMNYFLLVFLGLLILEISLCTMQKYLFLPNLSKDIKFLLILFLIIFDRKYIKHLNLHNLRLILLRSLYYMFSFDQLGGAHYLQANLIATASEVWNDLASFLILFNYVIPISLYVTLGER